MKNKCQRCSWSWYSKDPEIEPKECPNCKSYKWKSERMESAMKIKTKQKQGGSYGAKSQTTNGS